MFHGYPEVFVPLMGWRVFEPTVPAREEAGFFQRMGIDIKMDPDQIWTTVSLVVICALGGLVIRVLLPVLTELAFLLSLLFTPSSKRCVRRYKRLVSKLAASGRKDLLSMTPREFSAWYEERFAGKKRKVERVKRLTCGVERSLYMQG